MIKYNGLQDILQVFNVPKSYKNKSLLKRMEDSGNKSCMYIQQ